MTAYAVLRPTDHHHDAQRRRRLCWAVHDRREPRTLAVKDQRGIESLHLEHRLGCRHKLWHVHQFGSTPEGVSRHGLRRHRNAHALPGFHLPLPHR